MYVCCNMSCYAMVCVDACVGVKYVMLCYVMLCYGCRSVCVYVSMSVMLCNMRVYVYAILCYAVLCFAMSVCVCMYVCM